VTPLLWSLLRLKGSVIPKAMACALPSAIATTICVHYRRTGDFQDTFGQHLLSNNAAYTGFMTAISFLFVFRTSQAYSRFWEGMTLGQKMFAEWLDFAASTVAFTRFSEASERETQEFHHRLVRLLSLLHAQASSSLRGIDGSRFEILDLGSIVKEDLDDVWVSDQPVTLVTQWILELVVEGMHRKILTAPPPVCSRVFQEFAAGVVAFHDAKKLEKIHFPFPYTQLAGLCLLSHCLLAPFIISEWVLWKSSAFALSLLQVMVYWALYLVAVEIEAPFRPGDVIAEFGAQELQKELNIALATIVSKRLRRIPRLVEGATMNATHLLKHAKSHVIDSRMPGVARTTAETRTTPNKGSLIAKVRYLAHTGRRHSRATILEQAAEFQEQESDHDEVFSPVTGALDDSWSASPTVKASPPQNCEDTSSQFSPQPEEAGEPPPSSCLASQNHNASVPDERSVYDELGGLAARHEPGVTSILPSVL